VYGTRRGWLTEFGDIFDEFAGEGLEVVIKEDRQGGGTTDDYRTVQQRCGVDCRNLR